MAVVIPDLATEQNVSRRSGKSTTIESATELPRGKGPRADGPQDFPCFFPVLDQVALIAHCGGTRPA
jgi:hypothetical protein